MRYSVVSWMFLGCLAALTPTALQAEEKITVEFNGYYRLRGYYYNELDLRDSDICLYNYLGGEEPDMSRLAYVPEAVSDNGRYYVPAGDGSKAFTNQRLRLEPSVHVGENLAFFASMDLLDQVIGGHQSASPAPLFASSGSNHQENLLETDSIAVKRAWFDYMWEGVGILHIGRVASHFGLGLFSNDGGNSFKLMKSKSLEEKWSSYFDEDFGDNEGGSSFDRILFATKPLGEKSDLFTALYWDHLVESDVNKGKDDVDEYGLVTYYGPDPDKETGELFNLGTYIETRRSYGTRTRMYINDWHLLVKKPPFYTEWEGVMLWGHSDRQGIPFAQSLKANFGDIFVWMLRSGYDNGHSHFRFEAGFAPGDAALGNSDRGQPAYPSCNGGDADSCKVTTFNMHSDVKAGLLLFDKVLAQNLGLADFAAGSIINAFYLYPTFKYRLRGAELNGTNLLAGVLWAQSEDAPQFRGGADKEDNLGLELDGGVQHYFSPNMRFDLQGGYLFPGRGLPVVIPGDDPTNAWALISKFTVVF